MALLGFYLTNFIGFDNDALWAHFPVMYVQITGKTEPLYHHA